MGPLFPDRNSTPVVKRLFMIIPRFQKTLGWLRLLAVPLLCPPGLGHGAITQMRFQEFEFPSGKVGVSAAVAAGDVVVMLHLDRTISKIGAASGDRLFRWNEETSPTGMTNRGLATSGGYIYLGGDFGALARTSTNAWGTVNAGSLEWVPNPPKAIGSERNHRMAVIGSNLVTTLYLDNPSKVWYGSPTLSSDFNTSGLPGLGISEVFTGIRDIGEGRGVLFGSSGLVRITTNSGVTFSMISPPQVGLPRLTDGTVFADRLVMISGNGTVMSAPLTRDLTSVGWTWSTNRITTNALRSVAITGDGLLAVGEGGTAFLLGRDDSIWRPVVFPTAGMLAKSWVYAEAPTNGALAGTLVLVATNSVFVGAPAHPAPVLASSQSVLRTCEESPTSSMAFVAALDLTDPWARFAQIDWYSNGSLIATNSPSLSLRETTPGRYRYQAVARDIRTGIVSDPLSVEHVVVSLPAEPRTDIAGGVLRQCRDDGVVTLTVLPTQGVSHEWYLAPSGGNPVAQGDQYTPVQAITTSYYVEAIRRDGDTTCRSRTRLRLDQLVYENPSVPVANSPVVTVAECDAIPVLSVQTVPRVQFVWYEKLAGQSIPVATNSQYRPTQMRSSTFEVEAVSDDGGCRSALRTAVSMVVRPTIELAAIPDVVVPPQVTNKSVVVAAVPSQPLTETHALRWSTSGDGSFSSTNRLQTEYRPGTNDIALGRVLLTLRLEDPISACTVREVTAGIRYLPIPILTLTSDSIGQRRVEWPPTPGWRLQSSGNILFDPLKDEADGALGIYLIGTEAGEAFYRLAPKP